MTVSAITVLWTPALAALAPGILGGGMGGMTSLLMALGVGEGEGEEGEGLLDVK